MTKVMHWNLLEQPEQLQLLSQESVEQDIVIFKHSTRCSISRAVLGRLERNWDDQLVQAKPYFLDLLSHRTISNAIAEDFQVEHQSPQVLIIRNGQAIYDRSHYDIAFDEIAKILKN